jgi:hypothetical protein
MFIARRDFLLPPQQDEERDIILYLISKSNMRKFSLCFVNVGLRLLGLAPQTAHRLGSYVL